MKKFAFAFVTILAAITELFLGRGFEVETYKPDTKVAFSVQEGSSTCVGGGVG